VRCSVYELPEGYKATSRFLESAKRRRVVISYWYLLRV
jgi:hypothetical protein